MVTAIIDGTGSLGACITGVAITRMSTAFDTCHPSPKDCTVPGSDPGGWNGGTCTRNPHHNMIHKDVSLTDCL